MIPIKDNHDISCFLVTKHSWKGKYKRVFSIGTQGITTYNPDKLEVTNRWVYSDVLTLTSLGRPNTAGANEFSLVMKKDRKVDTMKFSSDHKNLILTEAFRYRHMFGEKVKDSYRYEAYKHHWSDTRLPVVLEVTPCSLDQLDPVTNTPLASYNYTDIEGIISVEDYAGGFVIACGGFSRLHLFAATNHNEIKNKMLESALSTLGITIKVLPTKITLDDFRSQRFGKYSADVHQTSVSEFIIHKVNSLRHIEPPRRILCLSDTCLLERDPQTYSVCCLRPLSEIFSLVRDSNNPQLFFIEYMNGHTRCYLAAERDALLASLLDGVRSSGNRDVHVKMQPTPRGKRFGPLHVPVDEETESNHLRFLISSTGHARQDSIERFNANIAYSGLLYSVNQDRLFSENKEKLIAQALQSLVQTDNNKESNNKDPGELEALFHAIRRLGASKVGFASFTTIPGFREALGTTVVAALRGGNCGVAHAALDSLCALLHPMHAHYDLRQEQLNKSSLLSSPSFLEGLLDMWTQHITQGSGALVVAAMLDLLTFSLCVPYSETTDSRHFDQLLDLVAQRGRTVFRLFEHPSMAIVKGAGLVMRALIEEGSCEVSARMQTLALAEAALPRHLLRALYPTVTSPSYRTASAPSHSHTHTHLSRHLVALWTTSHPPAMSLLGRIIPSGLLGFLDSNEKVPASAMDDSELERDNLKMAQEQDLKNKKGPHWIAIERQLKMVEKHWEYYKDVALQHWGAHTGLVVERKEKQRERPITLRRRREKIKPDANWPLFYYQFTRDHAQYNLIWNHKTREELRSALESEIRSFDKDRELSGNSLVCWNHTELEVYYKSLQDEVRIGDYYLRLLLTSDDQFDSPIRKSYEFFNELYHRFLLSPKIEMKCMCLQAMSIVYGKYYEDIGPFTDTKYIVQILEKSVDRMERDRLIIFIHKLVLHRKNVRDILEWNGVRILVELMTLAHLHTSRATAPAQNNLLEAAPDSMSSANNQHKEWYYNIEGPEGSVQRKGPVSFQEMKELFQKQVINARTKCWAVGMDNWKMLHCIPQLKWTLLARGSPVYNESDLASLILKILIKCCEYFPSRDEDGAIVRPLAKVKRQLSESWCLSHLVQLLLTLDPILVERVATLLTLLMQDNPLASRLYLTGVFYFIFMYTGSNLLPIARFLQLTHMIQAFRAEDTSTSDIMQRSILGQLLPEAMVCYLHNHGAEKFAQIFLGEYDTPEAIWNSEMRRMLILKVCAHVGDFTPRLRAHIGARYAYLPIPAVRYPQLESELFCNVFYLRHLCDTQKFPDWPIPNPVKLLKEVLESWRKEVEKKPPAMSVKEAHAVLGLPAGEHHDEAVLRKTYYRLAQEYHPDKNPNGRNKFEEVNKAYEYLCSRSVWSCDGPNPNNIVLVLRTQSILFSRYSKELEPYKYAGYPQLIKTIQLESGDNTLFSKTAPLLAAACELCHHTVRCSNLNAQELTKEGGLQILLEAYSRCVSVVSLSSKNTDVAVQVCEHISRCYAVAASFTHCLQHMLEMSSLITDLCRLLHFKHLGNLCCSGVECVAALSIDPTLQHRLILCGALWPLISHTLNYDYTLDEGGVERSKESTQQEVSNELARLCVNACARLGGYVNTNNETKNVNFATNAGIQKVFEALLTSHLAAKLATDKTDELLKMLNSNWRNPYLIWDNSTRAELSDFLRNRRKHGLDLRADEEDPEGEEDLKAAKEMSYSAHEGQLIIGNIFIQIYNEQPTFPIENPKGFSLDLLSYLSKQSQGSMDKDKLKNIEMALDALANVIKANTGIEIQCIGHFGLIFGLLGAQGYPGIQRAALEVIIRCGGCVECVDDISAARVLGHLLLMIGGGGLHQLLALRALQPLLTSTPIVHEALNKGAVMYLLDIFCNSNSEEFVDMTCDLISKMMADKLHGPKVNLSVCRYLPSIFGDAMRSGGAEAASRMLNTPQQHPELVWDASCKERVCALLAKHKEQHYSAQLRDPSVAFSATDARTSGDSWVPEGEVVVGGVYLRLFVANPHWTLRSPRTFLSDLLDCISGALTKGGQNELLELCTVALCGLLEAQPSLADFVAARGHLPRLCAHLLSSPQHALPLLNTVANNQVCVSSLAQTDCMSGLKETIRSRSDLVGMACEALSRIFTSSANTDELVLQAMEHDLVGELLKVLEKPGVGRQAIAQAVAALKGMASSQRHGERMNTLLNSHPAWKTYALQRHDLFIADAPQHHYLTAGVPQTAGYLTQAPNPNITLQPPPVD